MSFLWSHRWFCLACGVLILGLACVAASLVRPAAAAAATSGSQESADAFVYSGPPLRWLADLLIRLDLTGEQRAEIRQILAAHRPQLEQLLRDEADSRRVLRQAIHQVEVDGAAIAAAAGTVAAVDLALAEERARIFTEIYPLLTPDQVAEVAAFTAQARAAVAGRIGQLDPAGAGLPNAALDLLEQVSRLELTPWQLLRLAQILADHRDELVELVQEELAARQALLSAIRQPAVNEPALWATSEAVAAVDLRLALERAAVFAEAARVLSSEQQEQVRQWAEETAGRIFENIQALHRLAGLL